MASIHKRPRKDGTPRWVVSFADNYGRRTERVAGSTKKAAEALKVKIERELAEGTFGIKRDNPTFQEFARRFLRVKKGTVKPSTQEFYSRTINNYLLPHFRKLHVSEVTPSRVQELLERLADDGKSPATQAKALRTVRVIMRWALTLELIERDPTLAIRAPKVSRKELVFLDPPQFNQLLAACEGNLHILTAIAGMTGLREGEIVALKWKDVDFENGVIRVMRNYFPGHGFSDLKSLSSRRAVPMVNTLKNILLSHWQAHERPGEEELVVSTTHLVHRSTERALRAP